MPAIAFLKAKCIAQGDLREVALKAKAALDRDCWAQVLIFDDVTSAVIEVDFRGTAQEVSQRLPSEHAESDGEARKPGRPKLGVVAREVTLLPRHWQWLAAQPGGASVALRKLVEEARKANQGKDQRRSALDAAYLFLSAMTGNEPRFEEATRALFAGNREQFESMMASWPVDVRDHARRLAAATWREDA